MKKPKKTSPIEDMQLSSEELEIQEYMDNLLETGTFSPDIEVTSFINQVAINQKKRTSKVDITFTVSRFSPEYQKFQSLKDPNTFMREALLRA